MAERTLSLRISGSTLPRSIRNTEPNGSAETKNLHTGHVTGQQQSSVKSDGKLRNLDNGTMTVKNKEAQTDRGLMDPN